MASLPLPRWTKAYPQPPAQKGFTNTAFKCPPLSWLSLLLEFSHAKKKGEWRKEEQRIYKFLPPEHPPLHITGTMTLSWASTVC